MNYYDSYLDAPVSHETIGTGEAAIFRTVDRMRNIIHSSSGNPYIRDWAKRALGQTMVNDKWGEASAIHNFVRDNIRYTKDPKGIEFIVTPPVLLAGIGKYLSGESYYRPIGDCDDMTVLSLSLMKSIGFETAIVVASFNEKGQFSHVYGYVKVDDEWVPTDSVRPDSYLGWEAPRITRKVETMV